jgi:hypothetical protein
LALRPGAEGGRVAVAGTAGGSACRAWRRRSPPAGGEASSYRATRRSSAGVGRGATGSSSASGASEVLINNAGYGFIIAASLDWDLDDMESG